MLILKDDSVKMAGLNPEMDNVLTAINLVYAKYNLDTVVTAGTEEFDDNGNLIHSVGSLHPRGYALDIRNRDIPDACYTKFVSDLRNVLGELGKAYQLILKHPTHFHIEYDLKIAWRAANEESSL